MIKNNIIILFLILATGALSAETYSYEFREWKESEKVIYAKGVLDGLHAATILIEQDKPLILFKIRVAAEVLALGLGNGIEPHMASIIVRELRKRYWYE